MRLAEREVGDVRVVLTIAGDEGVVVFERDRRGDEIESAGADALATASQVLSQRGAAPGGSQGQGDDGYPGQEGVEARVSSLRVGAAQYSPGDTPCP